MGTMTPTTAPLGDLALRFREQERFAGGYAPLYRRLFATIAAWLESDRPNAAAAWLVGAAAGRPAFDVTLLLAAAIHREVLAHDAGAPVDESVIDLARFYPTAGGLAPRDDDASFDDALLAVILAEGDRFADFIGRAGVQTNETARGLAWLLPAAMAGWDAINLVEVGASAGLNLVAERRAYSLVSGESPAVPLLTLGLGRAPQFVARVAGEPALPFDPSSLRLPRPVTRRGGDLSPFPLATAGDELALASFVWADQPARLDRLREGIAAARHANRGPSPIRISPLRLPDELGPFMDSVTAGNPSLPTIVYNTTMSMYLERKAAGLREAMTTWANEAALSEPLLWLQWEPPHHEAATPPEYGWLAWTADLWAGGLHRHWLLGWVHPHGTSLVWEPGVAAFAENVRKP
jgi:hypothetical protein